jgi:hypothetical protein
MKHTPEYTEHFSLVFLQWITHHDFTLSGPEESSCDAENSASENEKPLCPLCLKAVGQSDPVEWI